MNKLLVIVVALMVLGALFVKGLPIIERKLSTPEVYQPTQVIQYVQHSVDSITTDVKPAPDRALLPGTKWIPQTFNNCGPATTAMVLQYFGHNLTQQQTKAALRTNDDDKNVFTYEMSAYLKTFDVESKLLYNGNQEILKTLIANGFYVVVEDWLHPNEDIGHVTILRGYDDSQGVFVADDSYLGVNIVYKYGVFDTQWKTFNREYLPVYKVPQEKLLKQILGDNWDQTKMWQGAVKRAEAEISQNPKDMYAYFNLGSSYFGLADFQKAGQAYDQSQALGWPRRMLWYQIQPVQTQNKLGNFQKAIQLADLGLWSNDSFAELHLEKAIAYQGLNNNSKAKDEANTALKYYPNFKLAVDLLNSL